MKAGNPTKVVLLNGSMTDTWSKEWAAECLKRNDHVQAVLGMLGRVNREHREAYYASVGRHEGAEAEKRVRDEVARVWKAEAERMKGGAA